MAKRFARTPSGKPRSFVSLNQPTAPPGARGQKKKGADDMQSKQNLQDLFLLRAKRDRVPVTMFLMNGFQMRGVITGFDAFVVVLDSDGKQQVIYKHAISTIAPARPVDLAETES